MSTKNSIIKSPKTWSHFYIEIFRAATMVLWELSANFVDVALRFAYSEGPVLSWFFCKWFWFFACSLAFQVYNWFWTCCLFCVFEARILSFLNSRNFGTNLFVFIFVIHMFTHVWIAATWYFHNIWQTTREEIWILLFLCIHLCHICCVFVKNKIWHRCRYGKKKHENNCINIMTIEKSWYSCSKV